MAGGPSDPIARLPELITIDAIQIALLCMSMLSLGFRFGSTYVGTLAYNSMLSTNPLLFNGVFGTEPAWVGVVRSIRFGGLVIFAIGIFGVLLLEYVDSHGVKLLNR